MGRVKGLVGCKIEYDGNIYTVTKSKYGEFFSSLVMERPDRLGKENLQLTTEEINMLLSGQEVNGYRLYCGKKRR